jgi:hypothetical protein
MNGGDVDGAGVNGAVDAVGRVATDRLASVADWP